MSGVVWSQFYWSDWESDPALRLCSMAAQGFWMRLLCIAAKADPTGYVTVKGTPLDGQDLARLTGVSVPEAETWLSELDRNGVLSRDRTGRIYCRRMVRDAKRTATARKNGKKGGNPTLGNTKRIPDWDNPWVNPRLKPQKPESRKEERQRQISSPPRAGPAAAAASIAIPERRCGAGEPPDRARLRDRAVDLHRLVCARLGVKDRYRGDLGEVLAWLEAGHGEATVLAAIDRVIARENGQMPTSLSYFREIVAEEAARGRAGSRTGPRPAAASPPVFTSATASEQTWRRAIGFWAKNRARYGPEERDWPDHARWPRSLGASPARRWCSGPEDILAELVPEEFRDPPLPAGKVSTA